MLSSADIAHATQSGDLTRVPVVILRATERLAPFMLEQLRSEPPDVVVLDSNALWGHIAARTLHLPTVSLMTTFPPVGPQFMQLRLREWLHMLRPIFPNMRSLMAARSRLLRQFRGDVVPRPAFPARGDLNIAMFPREFQSHDPSVNDTFRFVGPTIDDNAERGELPFDPAAIPEPVVYVSLGTLHLGSLDFFRQCFQAFASLPARFVLSVGAHTDVAALGTPPTNFIVRQSVPQLAVLRHAACFITHGGMNSALEGLWCGVPMIVIPQHVEQLLIGLHLAERGAALVLRQHIAGSRLLAADLQSAVSRILAEPRFREAASTLQQSLHATGGFRAAADEIQRLAVARAR